MVLHYQYKVGVQLNEVEMRRLKKAHILTPLFKFISLFNSYQSLNIIIYYKYLVFEK
jgi:hypothetical protein